MQLIVSLMAAGVLLSGVRDLLAMTGLEITHWPWPSIDRSDRH